MGGFFLPGFLLNRLLVKRDDFGAACLISMVVLFHLIFWTGILGLKINLWSIGLGLLLTNLLLLGCCWHQGVEFKSEPQPWTLRRTEVVVLLLLVLMVLVLFLRASLFYAPLGGDGFFRWNLLAARILETESFAYYPPLAPADYELYFHVDSFPPLVSFTYFWLYALFGRPATFLHGIPVTLQFILMFGYGYKLALALFNSRSSALLAVLVMGSSTLLFYSVVLTFETGLTALSLLALAYYLIRTESCPWPDLVLAAFATAVGALTREYGGVFVLFGIIIILWRKLPWRALAGYLVLCAVMVLPWYIRVDWLTGNPFYSNPVGNLFPVNPVQVGMVAGYHETIGLKSFLAPAILKALVPGLAYALGLPFFLGMAALLFNWKRLGAFFLIAVVMFALWLYSIAVPGGLFHSMRILSPALAVLAVCAAYPLGALSAKSRTVARTIIVVLICANLVALFQNLFLPLSPWGFRPSQWGSVLSVIKNFESAPNLSNYTNRLPDHARMLSDNANYHAGLVNSEAARRNLHLVPVWSKEVSFLFESKPPLSFDECVAKLRALKINYVLMRRAGNLNFNYLGNYEFFKKFDTASKLIYEDDIMLFELPELKAGLELRQPSTNH